MPFSIKWRDAAMSAGIFIIFMIGFGFLASKLDWPNDKGGWPLALVVAAIFALLPIAARVLSFMQQSGAILEIHGFKIDLSRATEIAAVGEVRVTDNLVDPGVYINATSFAALNETAVRATSETIVVVNLKDGRAWYKTRLFALAATAEILHAPRFIVLLGQRGGQSMQVGGWIRPSELVRAIIRSDSRYKNVWLRAQAYLYRVQANILSLDRTDFCQTANYQGSFNEDGAASFMFILVHQMQEPDKPSDKPPDRPPGTPPPQPPPLGAQLPPGLPKLEGGEGADSHPWISLGEVEAATDAWLVRDAVDRDKPDAEQVAALLAAKGDIVVATRGGRYTGVIDVSRAERELMRQLLLALPKSP